MTQTDRSDTTLSAEALLAPHMPALRRHARALTGSQQSGDAYAAASLAALAADPAALERITETPRKALFQAFHLIWATTGAPADDPAAAPGAGAAETREAALPEAQLAALTPNAREALLLSRLEGFATADVADIIGVTPAEAEELVRIAVEEMQAAGRARVMIIEDEAIIAMDLHGIVSGMGHEVVGIARTRAAAEEMGARTAPDLILADIQLADRSSGIEAVSALVEQFGPIPVVFITAFPERLLTGTRPEPAFLIAKPYEDEQVRSAVGQALMTARRGSARDG